MYPLVRELAATRAPVRVPVAVTCRALGFSTQAYYKWKKKPLSARQEEEQHLISILKVLHEKDPEGGYRVLADDLTDLGYRVSERRVWRLCHIAGIRSTITTRKRKYTVAGPPAHDDLVRRQFRTDHPNRLWLGDITEHPTKEGKLYLCAFKDMCSNEIVGYSMDSTMTADLAVNALKMALTHRGHPEGVVVHTDRGSQFRSKKFLNTLDEHKLCGSMGQVGAVGDNVAMESFFALLQKNVLDRKIWNTREELRLAIVSWIEGIYHRKRRQRALGKLTPVEFMTIMEPVATLAA